jgi:hypothetical protein
MVLDLATGLVIDFERSNLVSLGIKTLPVSSGLNGASLVSSTTLGRASFFLPFF